MSLSTLYTVGTALNRARGFGARVEVLVEGEWLGGHVLDVDGHGVILEGQDNTHAVVRMEAVSAVRVFSDVPLQVQIPDHPEVPSAASA